MTFAMSVQHILIVINVSLIRCKLEPFPHRMSSAHRSCVQHQNTRLKIVVRIIHSKDVLGVIKTLALLHIDVSDKINISHRTDKIVTQISGKKLRNVTLNDEIGIEIEHFIVKWQEFLNQETVISLNADMRVIRRKLIILNSTRNIRKTQRCIRKLREERLHGTLIVSSNIPLHHYNVITIFR